MRQDFAEFVNSPKRKRKKSSLRFGEEFVEGGVTGKGQQLGKFWTHVPTSRLKEKDALLVEKDREAKAKDREVKATRTELKKQVKAKDKDLMVMGRALKKSESARNGERIIWKDKQDGVMIDNRRIHNERKRDHNSTNAALAKSEQVNRSLAEKHRKAEAEARRNAKEVKKANMAVETQQQLSHRQAEQARLDAIKKDKSEARKKRHWDAEMAKKDQQLSETKSNFESESKRHKLTAATLKDARKTLRQEQLARRANERSQREEKEAQDRKDARVRFNRDIAGVGVCGCVRVFGCVCACV
jgi:hypothetical protein